MRWRLLAWICIDLILVFALLLGAGVFYIYVEFAHPKVWLERLAKRQGVALSGVNVRTVENNIFSPAFEIKNLVMSNKSQGWSAEVKYYYVHFNLLKSIWHWRLSTDDIAMRGATIDFDIEQAHFNQQNKHSLLTVFPWLNAQEKVQLSDIRLNLQQGKIKDHLFLNALWQSSAESMSTLTLRARGERDEKLIVNAKVKKTKLGGFQSAHIDLRTQKLLLSWLNLAKVKVAKQDYRLDMNAKFSGSLDKSQFFSRFSLQGARVNVLQSLDGEFSAKVHDGKAQFFLPKLNINGQAYPQPIELNLNYNRLNRQLHASGLVLKPLVPLVYLLDTTSFGYPRELDRLSSLQGHLTEIHGDWQSAERWQLAVRLVDLGVKPTITEPGITGVSGELVIAPDHMRFDLDSPNLHWLWPDTDKRQTPLLNTQAKIQVKQLKPGIKLSVSHIKVNHPQAHLAGKVSVIFRQQAAPVVTSRLDYTLATPEFVKKFIPHQGVNPELFTWLQKALLAGKTQGIAILNGALSDFPFTDGQGQFFVQFDVRDGQLDTNRGWPIIRQGDARVTFAGPQLTITANKALMAGLWLHDIRLKMADIMPGVPTELNIQGQSEFNLKKGMALIAKSPLKALVEKIKVSSGQGKINLNLKIPFGYVDKNKLTTVNGMLNVKNTSVDFTGKKVALTKLAGTFNFDEQGLVFAKDAKALIYGEPVNFSMNSQLQKQEPITTINFNSWLSAAVIKGLADIDLGSFVKGRTPIIGTYRFGEHSGNLSVNSKLQGLSSSLPAPFNKAINSQALLSLQEKKANNEQAIALIYGDQVKLEGHLNQEKKSTPALFLQANLKTLNLNEWGKTIQRLFSRELKSSNKDIIGSLNLTLDKLIIDEKSLSDVSLKVDRQASGVSIDVTSSALSGVVHYQQGVNIPELSLDFSKADLNIAQSIYHWYQTDFSGGNQSAGVLKRTKHLPKVTATLNNVNYKNYQFKSVGLTLIPVNYGYQLDSLQLTGPNYTVHATGELNLIQRQNPSFIKGNVHFSNVGKGLDALGINNLIGGGRGSLFFDLEWLGLLTDVKPETLLGRIKVNLVNGHITKVNPGLISLINVFNVDSFWQRIKFDSSGVLQKGLAFSELTGLLSIFHGNLFTNDMVVKGPDLQLSIGGRVGFANKDVDLLVGAVPQVSGSIPVIALAAGGLSFAPIAGALWLFEKALSSEVSNPFVFQYHVYGPWDDVQTKAVNSNNNKK
ncbi:putative protein involved in outer membrane biogenesis [Piscirickettsia salmonis]|uniref:YhdP family phospholipid transporter n=1 Tax=Piscirickettsia salmonis TaxID=1238 RepID=UPI0012BAB120|nr:DUF3971 domain-containing protein [Piscirickettsia salmonis]QGP53513.1 putative protein involved in outer membrane biogenesis [Piscirickettsia salmonis]QGP60571.1 putative protein involved in outer membrane biogenesis [Piscirickettsia salmonis]QGP63081.1 putative protein involved in outer membrane biogenesis [Piscirickettsia salmonis]